MICIRCLHSWSRFRQHVEMLLQMEHETRYFEVSGTREGYIRHKILIFKKCDSYSPMYWIDVVTVREHETLLGMYKDRTVTVPLCGVVVSLVPVDVETAVKLIVWFVEDRSGDTSETCVDV